MTALFSGFNYNGGVYHGWNSILCNAWDINWKTTIRKFNTFVEHGFSVEQKIRSDNKGTSVFTCDKKEDMYLLHLMFIKNKGHRDFVTTINESMNKY
jgi:hypothetical protein